MSDDGHKPEEPLTIYSTMLGLFCSACAPADMVKEEVEAAVLMLVKPAEGPWEAVDKEAMFGIGQSTPNPCDIYPHARRHWFLISR